MNTDYIKGQVKSWNKYAFYCIFFLMQLIANADTWRPTDGRMLSEWTPGSMIGVVGGIPTGRTQFCDATISIPGTNIVMSTNNADNTPALAAALRLSQTNSYIYIPDGYYVFTNKSGIATSTSFGEPFVNHVTIKGQSTNVIFYLDPPTNNTMTAAITFGQSQWASTGFKAGTGGSFFTSDAPAGTYSITLTNTPTDVILGGQIYFDMTNNEVNVTAHGNAYGTNYATAYDRPQTGRRSQSHRAVVTNVVGTTFNFTPPLPCDFPLSRAPFAIGTSATRSSKIYGTGMGIENITFRCNTNRQISKVVYFNGTHNSYVSNCVFSPFTTVAIYGLTASMCTIQHNWIGPTYNATVGAGYGIDWRASTGVDIVDNVIYHAYIPIITGASSMMAYEYNYIVDTIIQGGGTSQGGWININHGPHSMFSVVEGNIGGRIHADFNHGSSGNFVVYRNAYGLTNDPYSSDNRSAIRFDKLSLSNVVANSILGSSNQGTWYYELTNSGYSRNSNNVYQLGFPAIGSNNYDTFTNATNWSYLFDPQVSESLYRHGNYDYSTMLTNYISGNTNRFFENSVIYGSSPPPWWGDTNDVPYPCIGTDVSPNIGYNMARLRYESLTVSPYASGGANRAPVLTVPANSTINELSAYSATATATDADGNTLTYSITSGPSGLSINSSSGVISWTPTEAQGPGTYTVDVLVTDNGSPTLTDTESFTLTVSEVNSAPVLTVPSNSTINELSLYTASASATDSDFPANTLTYSISSGPSGLSINSSSGAISWTPTEAQGPGTYTVTVLVTDDGAGSLTDTESFTLTVSEVNSAPVLTLPADATINELSLYTATASATDSDSPANTLTYSLVSGPSGLSINSSSGAISWTPTEAQGPGSYTVTIKVTDNGSGLLSDTKSYTLTVSEVNSAPVLTAPSDATVDELTTYTDTLVATDSDSPANTLTYSLVSGPTGMTVNSSSGVVSWTPTEAQGPSVNTIVVRVTDNGSGSLTDTKSFTLTVTEVNDSPALTVPADATISELVLYNQSASAIDSDVPSNTLTYSLVSGPTGMTINASSGAISWTPTEAQGPGSYTVTVQVVDNGSPNLDDIQSFTLTVSEVNSSPTLVMPSDLTINEMVAYTTTISSTDADIPANTFTYELVSGPTGLTLNTTTGVISWTPTEAQGPGTYTVTIKVTDSGSPALTDTKSYVITVADVNVAPTFNYNGDATIRSLSPYTFENSASDTDIPANTLTYSLVDPPTGMTIDSATGIISWTPINTQADITYIIKTVVNDGTVNVTNTYILNVILPSITTHQSVLNWSTGNTIGNLNGLTNRSTIFCDVTISIPGTNIVAVGDGVTDDTAALTAAVRLCPTNQVVYIPAGTYRLKSTWNVAVNQASLPYVNNITIRGAGKGLTKIYADITNGVAGLSSAIIVGESYWQSSAGGFKSGVKSIVINSNLPAGLASISLATFPTNVINGATIWIDEANDNSIFSSYGSDSSLIANATTTNYGSKYTLSDRPQTGTRNHFHIAQITNITGNVIGFSPPIGPIGFTGSRNPTITGITPNRGGGIYGYNVGFENMTFIENTNNNKLGKYLEISSINNFVNNCSFSNITKVAIKATGSVGLEVTGCDFIGTRINSSYGNSIGIQMVASSGLLVENCLFYKCNLPILNSTLVYSAIVNSAFVDTKPTGNSGRQSVDIYLNHGSYSGGILVEGNVMSGIQADSSYGSGGNFVVYGNLIHGTGSSVTNNRILIRLDSLIYTNVIAGNWLSESGLGWQRYPVNKSYSLAQNYLYRFGYPQQDSVTFISGTNYQVSFNTNILASSVLHANYDGSSGKIENDINYNTTLPNSLLFTNTPSYFTNQYTYPPFAGRSTEPVKTSSIPAYNRF